MKSKLSVLAGASLCLVCACAFASAPAFAAEANKTVVANKAPAPKTRAEAALPEAVGEATVTIIPSADIVVTFPLLLTERGIVESVDLKAKTFELKRKDGSMAKISVGEGTLVENVYLDIFHSESRKGIDEMKKGDKVRARVFPPQNGEESALMVDVFHF